MLSTSDNIYIELINPIPNSRPYNASWYFGVISPTYTMFVLSPAHSLPSRYIP